MCLQCVSANLVKCTIWLSIILEFFFLQQLRPWFWPWGWSPWPWPWPWELSPWPWPWPWELWPWPWPWPWGLCPWPCLGLEGYVLVNITGCSKAEPKIFGPPQIPFPGARDGQNLISWRWSLPLPTNPVWWGSMHAISSYRGNRPTPPARPFATDRGDYNTLRRSLARSVKSLHILCTMWG